MEKRTKRIIIISCCIGLTIGLVTTGVLLYYYLSPTKTENKETPKNVTDSVINVNLENSDASQIKARSTMFNVDQADASLIQVKDKDNNFQETNNENFDILVDCGVKLNASTEEKTNLIKKIQGSGVKHVDLIVITHAHFDHLGALSTLNSTVNTDGSKMVDSNTTVLLNFQEYLNSKPTSVAAKSMKALEDSNVKFADAITYASRTDNMIVNFGKYGYLSVLTPLVSQSTSEANDWSIINRFEFNGKSTLYTGDATGKTTDSKNFLSSHLKQFDADYLKAPHHGSATNGSNSMSFLKMVSPTEVWISAGHSDKYTLPDVTALKNYLASGVLPENIKGTDYFGNKDSKDPSKWEALNNWIKEHPTVNNNNIGYTNGIIQEY